MTYKIRVFKEYFEFTAGHFITYAGQCETLHGHNYRVEVQLGGENGPDAYLFNFSDLKPLVRAECQALDHKMLLAAANDALKYNYLDEQEIEVRYGARRYVFPVAEVAMLPVRNTTAEELAAYLLHRVRQGLIAQNKPEVAGLRYIEVGVEEKPGQMAYYGEQF